MRWSWRQVSILGGLLTRERAEDGVAVAPLDSAPGKQKPRSLGAQIPGSIPHLVDRNVEGLYCSRK